MPELPEVEVTKRSLQQLVGAKVLSARLGAPLRWPLGIDPAALVGLQITDIGRRGKYVLMQLAPQGMLLLHLGMSGRLALVAANSPAGKHDHFDLFTTKGLMRLHDPRRFGAVVWAEGLDDSQAQRLLGRLGVEPLSDAFTLEGFQQGLAERRGAIKQVLLAGELVVGVGNIYASETLFLSKIHPERSAKTLSRAEVLRLHQAVVAVLRKAVDEGGSSLKDFQSPDGVNGHYQQEAQVYAREGLPCRVCGQAIRMIRQGQRSTFYCETCQK